MRSRVIRGRSGGSGGGGGSSTGFPDSSNTGFANAPGLTVLASGASVTIASGNTYNFLDFPAGATLTSLSNITFNGCRFQSNAVSFANVRLTDCSNIIFNYCSMVPLLSLAMRPTHPGVWPSAGVAAAVDGVGGYAPYMINGNNGYQYGVRLDGATGTGGVIINHCDIWGFANAIDLAGALSCTVAECWIHDAANPDAQSYHTDGVGYLDGFGGRSNIVVDHNTIASLGNTNAIAFQAASSGYSNIKVRNNYFSGFGYCVDMCHNVSGNNNLEFSGNILATDLRWAYGPLYADFSGQFNLANPTNKWFGNKLKVMPATSPGPNAVFFFSLADNNKFVLPNSTVSAADWVPN
jgi:hypothetical protein